MKLARHLQGHRGEPRNSVQARSQGLRHGPGGSFHGYSAVKVVMSRAVDRSHGEARQMTFIGVENAHMNSQCHEDVSIRLPGEVGTSQGLQVQELAPSVPTIARGGRGAIRVLAEGTWFQEGECRHQCRSAMRGRTFTWWCTVTTSSPGTRRR